MTGTDIVVARLLAVSAVTTLVGSRVRALMLAQGDTLPAIRVSLVVDLHDLHLRGGAGVHRERVQVDAYATTLAAARAVADAALGAFAAGVATGLHGWSGSIGSPATVVDRIEALTRVEAFDADERQQCIVTQDFEVQYRR